LGEHKLEVLVPFPGEVEQALADRGGEILRGLTAHPMASRYGRTALAIYDLADAMPGVIHLTTDRRFRGSRRGVIVHQAHLAEGDVTRRDGIPVTTPLRTVTDVATDQSVAVAAVAEAIERGLLRAHQLRKAAEDRPVLAELLSRMSSE
jgi:predicted transcriptional regulator of viral defense system